NFQKGCYIGQELTARTFHTGVIRKRIVPLQLEFPADIECDATITTKEKGKNAGKFRSAKGIYGLGLLRVAHLKDELVVMDKDGKGVPVTPHVPDWWPHGIV
ncbi:Caf17, partial [Plakobranchus ocellatus]